MKQQLPPVVRRWRTLGVALGAAALFAGSGVAAPSDPATAMGFHPVVPERVLDTRSAGGPLAAGETRNVVIDNLPDDASAVSLNVTAVSGTTGSFAVVWRSGATRPSTSTINWTSAGAVANSTIVSIDSAHSVSVYNERGTVNLVLDLVGYYAPGAAGASGADGAEGDQGPQGPEGPEGPQGNPTTYLYAYNTASRTVLAAGVVVFGLGGASAGGIGFTPGNGVFTAPEDGVYKVSFGVAATTDSQLRLLVDGLPPSGGAQVFGAIAVASSVTEEADLSVNTGSAVLTLLTGEDLTLVNAGAGSLTLPTNIGGAAATNNAWIVIEQLNASLAPG